MPRKKVLVKVSGDEFRNSEFLKWIGDRSRESYVVICVGGGTQINKEFTRRGFRVKKKGPAGREPDTFEQLQVARDTVEVNAMELEDILAEQGIYVRVEVPFWNIGGVFCFYSLPRYLNRGTCLQSISTSSRNIWSGLAHSFDISFS